jgi:hypothetical protein
MKDASFTIVKALPNAAANNNTSGIDLRVLPTSGGAPANMWRLAYVEITFPALSDHTNTSVSNLITLQHAADDNTSNYANTVPLIQAQVVGVGSTGSAATTFRVPFPPDVKRFIRFNQTVPTNGGVGSNANVTYDLVV